MKNKTFLPLLEQVIMVLFFALAAAVCLLVFSHASEISNNSEALDLAVVCAQNTAETLKSTNGDLESAALLLTGTSDAYTLKLYATADGSFVKSSHESIKLDLIATKFICPNPYFEGALICVYDQKGACIYELEVHWQKEVTNE